jgi:hypothetical protein
VTGGTAPGAHPGDQGRAGPIGFAGSSKLHAETDMTRISRSGARLAGLLVNVLLVVGVIAGMAAALGSLVA